MKKILLGDNQFFGVNHMSEEKARMQFMKFQKTSAIIEVIDAAYSEGIHAFMCTTHERISEICRHIQENSSRYQEFEFYPCMPYAHKYVNAVTEFGMLGALHRFIPNDGAVSAFFKGGMSILKKDVVGISELLIDAEMKMFSDLKTPVIFLQNVVTDLLLGLGAIDGFRIFFDYIRKKYGAEAGFITMNLPRLLQALKKAEIENPIVCSNINKAGFRMCGGIAQYEETIATQEFRPIDMSVLASGALRAEEAIEYIGRQPQIKSVVFGASSPGHIQETKRLIDKYMAEN
jgi:hypothetical protein